MNETRIDTPWPVIVTAAPDKPAPKNLRYAYFPVNGRLDWWAVRIHRHNGLTYARRVRRDGTINKKPFWVQNPQHLRLEIPADGKPPYEA